MLKGMHPHLASLFGISYEHQGWITGKRIGISRNLGPAQVRKMRKLGKFPPAKRFIPHLYANLAIKARDIHQ